MAGGYSWLWEKLPRQEQLQLCIISPAPSVLPLLLTLVGVGKTCQPTQALQEGLQTRPRSSSTSFPHVPVPWRPIATGCQSCEQSPAQPGKLKGRSLKPRGHRGFTSPNRNFFRPCNAFSAVWCLTAHPGGHPRPSHALAAPKGGLRLRRRRPAAVTSGLSCSQPG